MLTKGKFLVSFEVPGHTKEYTEGFTEEMVIPYRTEELNPYLIYIPHQDTWTEHFPNPGSNKKDYTLYLSDPQAQYNKLLRTPQKLRNKKK